MKEKRFSRFVNFIIDELEGGSKIITDSGGLTRYGIAEKFNKGLNVEKLTREQAVDIYKNEYWKTEADDMFPQSAFLFFENCINPGIGEACKNIQKALNTLYETRLIVDGIIGEKTRSSMRFIIDHYSDMEFSRVMLWHKRQYYNNLASNKKYNMYLRGWINRCQKIELLLLKEANEWNF